MWVSNGVCVCCLFSEQFILYLEALCWVFFVVVVTKYPHFTSSLKQQLVLYVISESNDRFG